jgi:hypothetical protein
MEERVELRAMSFVRNYYEKLGWKAENVSRTRGAHAGYDFLLTQGSEQLKVEVKGCSRPYGIPDQYHSEFDEKTLKLIADVLCVVYFFDSEPPKLAIIPRDSIPPEYIVPKRGYRIKGKFKNEKTIRQFLVDS